MNNLKPSRTAGKGLLAIGLVLAMSSMAPVGGLMGKGTMMDADMQKQVDDMRTPTDTMMKEVPAGKKK